MGIINKFNKSNEIFCIVYNANFDYEIFTYNLYNLRKCVSNNYITIRYSYNINYIIRSIEFMVYLSFNKILFNHLTNYF